ncbi:MAG TPA: hypothetical protein VL443_22470 [Cyclobacteriaceae bacterium]|nr:hypothetical protein [Cyclobacteriaceae bacterium]
MKTKIILGLALLSTVLLTNCGNQAREKQLQAHADSLATELKSNQEAMATLQEVGVILDSIDQNRATLRVNMVEGTTRLSYASRLKNINQYVKQAENKIATLEESLKKSGSSKAGYLGTIHRLKTELEDANKQLAVLQEEGMKLRNEKGVLVAQVSQKDSLITEREQFIKVKENELVAKEEEARKMSEQTQIDKANLYYAQASALETAANRTKLAPRKKKETRREAIELYKIALSLGKTEAQERINELEKEVS